MGPRLRGNDREEANVNGCDETNKRVQPTNRARVRG